MTGEGLELFRHSGRGQWLTLSPRVCSGGPVAFLKGAVRTPPEEDQVWDQREGLVSASPLFP